MDAHGVEAGGGEGFGEVKVGEGGVEGGGVAATVHPGEFVEEEAGGFEPEFHVGDAVGDGLEFSDGLLEEFAFAGVGDAVVELAGHGADMAGEDEAAFPIHGGVEEAEADAFGAEAAGFGDVAILEDEVAEGIGAEAHFGAGGGAGEAGGAGLDEKNGDAPLAEVGVGAGEDEGEVADGGEADVGFATVEDVAAAGFASGFGGGAEVEGVGAGFGFGHAVGTDEGAVGETGEVGLFLFVGAEAEDGFLDGPELAVDGEGESVVAAAVTDAFEHADGGGDVPGLAAEGFGHEGGEDAEVGAAPPEVAVECVAGGAVERFGGEGDGAVVEGVLVVGPVEGHGRGWTGFATGWQPENLICHPLANGEGACDLFSLRRGIGFLSCCGLAGSGAWRAWRGSENCVSNGFL